VALQKTTLLAKAHGAAATQGQSQVPDANADVDMHFVAFIQASSAEGGGNAHKRIVELDGRRPGPIDHGPSLNFLEVCAVYRALRCTFLPLTLVHQDVAKLMKKNFIPHSTSQNFGLVSLGRPPT
jgi:ubiquitin carboxyl-terminal hydrolase L3